MTGFEWLRARADRFLPVLHGPVRRDLVTLIRDSQRECPRYLEADGRFTPGSVGLPATISIERATV